MTDNNTNEASVMGAGSEENAGSVTPGTTTQAPQVPPVAPDEPEKGLKELRAEAIALGFPESAAKGVMTKLAMQTIIDGYRKESSVTTSPATKPVEKVATLEEKPNPREEKLISTQYQTKRDIMRAKLEAQPQVPIFIPKADDKPEGVVKIVKVNGKNEYVKVSGEVESFNENGYMVLVPKGVSTTVPLQIFKSWSYSQRATQQAGKEFSINRIDPETGREVSTRL